MPTLDTVFPSPRGGHRGQPQPHAACAAPGLALVLGRVSSAGKVRDVDWERQGTKAAGVMSRPTRRRSAVSVIDGAGQEPAAGATRGSLLIGPGGGRRSLCAAEHKEHVGGVICIVDTK